jgi:hypothetical protein
MSATMAVTTASTFATRTMTALAADWANTVHHVIKAGLELCKLGVSFSLCVLSRSNLFIKVRLKRCSERCLYVCNVNVLSIGDLLDGLA